jgi:hypothetical protein
MCIVLPPRWTLVSVSVNGDEALEDRLLSCHNIFGMYNDVSNFQSVTTFPSPSSDHFFLQSFCVIYSLPAHENSNQLATRVVIQKDNKQKQN